MNSPLFVLTASEITFDLTILWSFLILLGLGAILAVLIFFVTKFLSVKEDTRIDDVEKMLPGANCGACGFPGCRGFAEALVKQKEKKVSKCRVGKEATTYDPIIAYMKEHPNEDGSTIELIK